MTFGVTGGGLLPNNVEKERRVQYGEKDGKLGECLTTLQRFRVRHGLSCGQNFESLRVKRVMQAWRCQLCKKLVCVCDQVKSLS